MMARRTIKYLVLRGQEVLHFRLIANVLDAGLTECIVQRDSNQIQVVARILAERPFQTVDRIQANVALFTCTN